MYIKPVHLRNGVLMISATTAGWAQELTFKKENIKFEINKKIDEPHLRIKFIKIQITN